MFPSRVDLRVSDAEREAVADFLKRHYAAGRLSQRELAARVESAYRARRESQLVAVTRDLPVVAPPARPSHRFPRVRATAIAAAIVAVLVAGIAAVAALPDTLATLLVALAIPMLVLLVPLLLAVAAVVWCTRAAARLVRPRPRFWHTP